MERCGYFRKNENVEESFRKMWRRLGLQSKRIKKIVGFVALSNGDFRLMEPGDA